MRRTEDQNQDLDKDRERSKQEPEPTQPEWVHATNAAQFRPGNLFGWQSDESPTGWLSGFVVQSDPLHLRVLVRDIAPGYMGAWQ